MKVTKSSSLLASAIAASTIIGATQAHANPAAAAVIAGASMVVSVSAVADQAAKETITIAQETDPLGFDIVQARVSNQTTANAALAVMEGLFAYNDDGEIVPRLGTTMSVADDRLSATVQLRKGVTFHDGTPFNAAAVAAHYNRILDPENGLTTRMLDPIESVEAVGEHEVRFNLNTPWVALQSALAIDHMYNYIPSPTAIEADAKKFNSAPVGTGPFKFEEWKRGDRVTFTRNEQYWDAGLPRVDKLVIRSIPDEQTRMEALKSGEIEILKTPNPSQIVEVANGETDDISILRAPSNGAISWNINQKKEPLGDPEIRKAIVQSIDTEALNKALYKGTSSPVTGLFHKDSAWYCEDANWTTYDPEAAKTVVEEKGPISFELQSNNTPSARAAATFMEHFISKAGFGVQVDLVEQGKNIRDGITGEYDLNIWRYSDVGGDPDLILTNYMTSFVTRHDTSEYTKLLSEARQETDTAKRKEIYCEVQDKFAEDNLFVIPVQSVYTIMVDESVVNAANPRNSMVQVRDLGLKN